MSKIICAICGTSYPDTETQCPICGCVRPAEAAVSEDREESGGYTYVKGGRFSKANVRKRAQTSAATAKRQNVNSGSAMSEEPAKPGANKKIIGLAVVLILLLIIVVAMFVFIFNYDKGSDSEGNSTTTAPNVVACTGLDITDVEVSLTKMGEIHIMNVTVYPKGCTEKVTFKENSGGKVVSVDDSGKIICMGTGNAVVTASCGAFDDECRVKVEISDIPTVTFRYSEENPLTLTNKNEQQAFFESGDVTADKLRYESDDENVATVDEDGIIHAVGNGETIIHASYGNVLVGSCKVVCDFADPDATPGEEEIVDVEEYHFGSVYGKLTPEGKDTYGTSMKIGDEIQFGLIHKSDRSKNIYFEWERTNPDDEDQSVVASEDKKTIERVSEPPFEGSYCVFKATYEGKEYYLKIRYYG